MLRTTSDPYFGGLDSHVGAEATAHGATASITIPDAQLLFGGEYKRAGTDLILSNHDHEFVVHDYFRNGNKPTLLSPDGGRVTADIVEALTGHGDYAQAGAPAQTAPTVVGRVVKFDGYVTVIRNGVAVSLHVGDGVLKGDVLQTGTGTMAVTFNDGSTLTLTENSRLAVNDFVYQANGTANSEILDLVRGSLSFVSGEVAHSGGHMNITTPVATMGIRGTVGTVSNGDDGTVHFSIVESATGAVLLDSKGNVFATITANGPDITVHFQNAQLVAQETQKSPQEIAQQQATLQNILSTQAVGQQILQQFFNQQPNPNPQSTQPQHTQLDITITKVALDGGTPGPNNIGNNPPLPDNTPTIVHVVVTDNSNNHVILDDHIQQPSPPPASTNVAAVVDSGPHFIDVSAPGGGDASQPHLSADGTKMVFDPDGGIFYTDLNHPQTISSPISLSGLVPNAGNYLSFSNPGISADGSYIVFQGNFDGGQDVFIAHVGANDDFVISPPIPGGFDPQIDGGGFHLVMEQDNGLHPDVALFTRDNNGNWCQHTSICGDAAICNPNISANGHVITFSTAAYTITIGDQTFHVGGDGNVETYVYDTRAQNPWDALQVVSVSSDGRIANGDSVGAASLSQDGRFIVFESTACNLDGGAGETNIYLRDTVNHTTTLISRGIDGLPGDGNSFDASINPDGTYVVFTSCASNFVSGDINGAPDVFKYDIATGQITAVSDVINPLGAVDGAVSGGGLYVAYEKPGFTFDNQPVPAHIVVEDLSNGQTGIVVEDDNSPNTLTTTGTIDFTGDGTSVQVVTTNGNFGALTASVANGEVTWTYTVDKSVAAQVANGDQHIDTFTINLGNGGNVTPITVHEVIVGTNETPVISYFAPSDVAGLVGENSAQTATGQLSAYDPDQGDHLTWTIEGGTRMAAPEFQFAIDEFTVVKNNSTIFDDTFNGTTPPNGPDFIPAVNTPSPIYNVNGAFDGGTGAALIDSENAVFQGVRGGTNYVFGDFATLNTNTQPVNQNSLGLKSGEAFDVSGVFDLTVPRDASDSYGIRLIDRMQNGPSAQPGTETVELAVVHGDTDGTIDVQLTERDYATNTITILGSVELTPGDLANNQIILSLANDPAHNGDIQASFELADNGVVDSELTTTFPATGRIFDNETWTRAQFFGLSYGQDSSSPTADSVLQGTYGTLDLTQTGAWTYALNNGLAATQALGAGTIAHDSFWVDVTDSHGEVAKQLIDVAVNGVNDPPVAHDDTLASNVDHTFVENSFNTIHSFELLANDTDPDNNTTLTITGVSAHSAYGGFVTLNNDGTITYEGDEGFFGADSFTYTLSDGMTTSTGTVSFFVTPFFTSQVYWTGSQDSNWDHSGNWSSGQVPGGNSDVTIDTVTNLNGPTVTASNPESVHSLAISGGVQAEITDISVGQDLTITAIAGSCGESKSSEITAAGHDLTIGLIGRDLTISADANFASAASVTAGILASGNNITIGDVARNFTVEATGSGFSSSALAEIHGANIAIGNIDGDFLLSGTNYGNRPQAQITAEENLTIGNVAGDFSVEAGGCGPAEAEISAAGHDLTIGNIGGNFENQGTIQAASTLTIGAVFGASFVNDTTGLMQAGAINIADPVFSPVFTNDGTVQDWGSADSTIGVDVTNYGTFKVGGGPVQDIAGFGISIQGHVTNSGDVQVLDGGFIGLRGGLINQSSATLMAAGVATYGQTNTAAEIDISGVVSNAGSIWAGNPDGEGGGGIVFKDADVDNGEGLIAAYGGGGINLIDSTVTGGNVEAHGDGSRVFLSDATIIGSILVSDGSAIFATQAGGDGFAQNTLDGSASTLTNDAYIQIVDNTGLALRGHIYNDNSNGGFISVGVTTPGDDVGGARLIIDGYVTLAGHGDVVMQGLGNFIDGLPSNGCDTLDNVDNYIHGTGHLGDQYLTLSNEGLIAATGAEDGVNTIVINTGTNVVENDGGTIEAITGGQMTIVSDISNDSFGLIQSCGDGSLLKADGIVWNSATIQASFRGEVDFNNVVHNNACIVATDGGTVTFNSWLDNGGVVKAADGGAVTLAQVGGSGSLLVDGGVITVNGFDTNDVSFTASSGALFLNDAGEFCGTISGFDFTDTIGFLGADLTVAGYDTNTHLLDLRPVNGGGDVFLSFNGSYDPSDFVTLYNGVETVLLDRPSPSPVGAGGGAGLWDNASGGDWGTATNWGNDALPGTFDPVDLTNVINGNPASYTATYNGAIDGIPGIGATDAASLEVDQGVTFDISNKGALFLSGDFENAGAVIADRGEIAGSGGGSNSGTITLSGDDTATGSIFLNGTFANTGHVFLNTGGSAQFGAVTDTGVMSIVGGTLEIDPLGHGSSGDTADTNNILFGGSNSTLLLGGEGQITGSISGFGVSDSIGFLNEQVTITSYVDDGTHGVLTLHVHSLDGGGDTDLSLNLQGSYTRADFLVVHGGQDTFLLEKPPGLVQASLNGVWSNASGGDWGTASNWHNNVVPGASDDILLSTPVGHTVTFNGAIDGIPGYGIGGANSLTVSNGVTFQVNNRGQLFFDDTLTNGGSVDVVDSGLSFGGNGANTSLITVEGATGVISSTFDMDNGTLANTGTVDVKARGWATIRSATGGGTLKVDGGVIELGGADATSAQTIDTNAIVFAAAGGLLMLDGQGAVAGHISGFDDTDNVSFIDEQVSVVNYDSNTGVLHLHLHSVDSPSLGDHDLSLTFDGLSAGNFTTQFDGLDSLLYFNPIPGPVAGGSSAGEWTNTQGGDWGVASNWGDNNVPNFLDDITLNSPVGHTVTFNGAIDGQAGLASAASLAVGAGVTFDVTQHGSLFFTGDLHNSGFIDVLDSGLSFGGVGVNTGTIDVHGTSGFISSTLDIDNGELNNTGTVIAGPHGEASFGSVIGTGVIVIDGGAFNVSGADSNDLQFSTAHSGELLIADPAQFTGTISGFAPVLTIGALPTAPAIAIEDENVTVSSYVDHGNHTGTLHLSDGSALNFDGDYAKANFVAQFDGLATTITDQGPVMSVANVHVSGDASSSTVTGISISDFFDLNPNDLFTITATAGHGTLALAVPGDDSGITGANTATLSGTGTLSQINHALSDGVIYTPTGSPATDNVSVAIQDHNGAIDEINFVFNQSGGGPNVSLTGTAGKDVLFGTGYNDTLAGGASSDTFVFKGATPGSATGNDTITDFNVFQDTLQLDHSVFGNSIANILASAQTDVNGNTTIHGAGADAANSTITLNHVTIADITQHQDHLLLV